RGGVCRTAADPPVAGSCASTVNYSVTTGGSAANRADPARALGAAGALEPLHLGVDRRFGDATARSVRVEPRERERDGESEHGPERPEVAVTTSGEEPHTGDDERDDDRHAHEVLEFCLGLEALARGRAEFVVSHA